LRYDGYPATARQTDTAVQIVPFNFESFAPPTMPHENCQGAEWVEYGHSVLGTGIGDLVGGREV